MDNINDLAVVYGENFDPKWSMELERIQNNMIKNHGCTFRPVQSIEFGPINAFGCGLRRLCIGQNAGIMSITSTYILLISMRMAVTRDNPT